MRGGFEGLRRSRPEHALYLKLGGPDGGEEKPAGGEDADICELAEKHFAGLKPLLDQFACETTPYLSRPIPKFASRFADLRPSGARQGMVVDRRRRDDGGDAS